MALDLSVLIATVTPRRSLLSRLLWGLTRQDGDFEILIHSSDEVSMGDKFNAMFEQAQGEFVVCVDDDDYLSDRYMELVLPKLAPMDMDFVGYRILALRNGAYWFEVEHRGSVMGWGEKLRGVSPKCPVRRDLARKIVFGNDYRSDEVWSSEVAQLVGPHGYIDRALYVYDWWDDFMLGTNPTDKPERWGNQRNVGSWPFLTGRIRWIGV